MKQTQRNKKLQELVLLLKALGYVNEILSNSTMKIVLENEQGNECLCIELDESEILLRVNDGIAVRQLPYDDYRKEVMQEIMESFRVEDEEAILQEVAACVKEK